MTLPAKSPFRSYQQPIFDDRESGVLILHWSRQIGKSYTLAAWAVDRIMRQLKKAEHASWLVTVLSNSRDNGAEFVLKVHEVCNRLGILLESQDDSRGLPYENMRMEVRITVKKKPGRIKVLAANPRTARGFSGDLILDEFAFHEDSNAIWEAAEPILSANQDFLCRIASTGNGKHNMFYRMTSGACTAGAYATCSVADVDSPSPGGEGRGEGEPSHTSRSPARLSDNFYLSTAGCLVSRVTRTQAFKMGVQVYDMKTRAAITPEAAREQAQDKRAYDQNYECAFADENLTLLSHELINAAERALISIDRQSWSEASVARMARAKGRLEVGNDIGRNRDLSFVTVFERDGRLRRTIAMLRMENLRLPDQQKQLDIVCGLPGFATYCGDMTGMGLGLVEYLQERWGLGRIFGVNFSSTEPTTDRIAADGRKRATARVTEIMATNLLAAFEDRAIEIPADRELRDDLRKPEKITSPGGRVSIAATRDEAGHADGFWSLALAVRAGDLNGGPFACEPMKTPGRARGWNFRQKGVLL